MINFKAQLQKFGPKGEKTGWTYIDVPEQIANQLKSGCKKSFRVKGKIDNYSIKAAALIPMGDGNFILAINATIRKTIKKIDGASVVVQLEDDIEKMVIAPEILSCLKDEPVAYKYFHELPPSHQNWFSNWVKTAKTEVTAAKRIGVIVNACSQKMAFSDMMKAYRDENKFTQ
ncbi:MAG: DUF1905 domain-containing protein [Ferruginibacter sp.]